MTYINEHISKEDAEVYGIYQVNENFHIDWYAANDWTIDKEQGCYLRKVFQDRDPDTCQNSIWHFFWNENLYVLRVELISGSGKRGGDLTAHFKINAINCNGKAIVPSSELKQELFKAFKANKGSGVYSTAKSYSLTLDIEVGE